MRTGENRVAKGARGLLAAWVLVLLAAVLPSAATPAWASLTGLDSVRPGKNITVFHNSDFIAVFGYPVGQDLTVDVYRGSHRIATTSGPAVATPEGGGLEVNHGPAGTAVRGDCWEGVTPDILPGDRVVVTDAAGARDEVVVDNVSIGPAGPVDTDPANPFAPVVLEGRAAYADGAPVPIEQLNSGELRQESPRFRAVPDSVERIPGTTDGWRATYQWPYTIVSVRESLTPQEKKDAVLNGDHAMGYGHIVPLPRETQIAESPAAGGPALDCGNPASPFYAPKAANAVTTADDRFVNLASGNLLLGGTAAANVTAVSVTLADGDAVTPDPTLRVSGLTTAPGDKGWSAEFAREDLERLNDGVLTATATFAPAEGSAVAGVSKKLAKDTSAPAAPTATPPAGLYNHEQAVTLNAGADATIRYTADGAVPTATTGLVYDGQISVTSSQTIQARAFDAAGNPGEVAALAYEIDTVAPTLEAGPAGGLFKETQSVSLASDDPGARIYYTTDGSVPGRSSQEFTSSDEPIVVGESKAIRALAVDAAGNETMKTFVYTIDTAAPTVSASLPAGSYDPSPLRSITLSASEPADVYFTTDGSTPVPGSPHTTKSNGPLPLDRTQTVKAVAADRAGNVGRVASFDYVIRRATSTNLNVASASLKVGKVQRISGAVGPDQAGGSVKMAIDRPAGQRDLVKNLPLNAAGSYSFSYKTTAVGRHTVQVSFAKDADSLGSVSGTKSFRAVR